MLSNKVLVIGRDGLIRGEKLPPPDKPLAHG